ncbi:hypothetical protein M1145_02200 [Patescibacteria group bacterium]|nr:hypothetical protein [Patescibacteria group bacterium]
MKDTKIFVDIDDEITFVTEKIINSQTNRVILIIPDKSEILSSIVGLKMLRHVIDKNDKNVVIVTTDDSGRNISTKAGFITEGKIGDVTENTWINVINLKKRLNDSEKLSKKHIIEPEVYEAVDNIPREDNTKNKDTVEERGFELVDEHQLIEDIPAKQDKDTTKKVVLENFEFLVGGDIASNVKNEVEDTSKDKDNDIKRTVSKQKNTKKNIDISSIIGKIPRKNKFGKKNKIIIILTIFILIIIFIVYYLFLTSANITITTKGSSVKNSAIITINPNITHIHTNNMQIPSKIVSVSESGSNSMQTTGTKTVSSGSYAKGTVTIGNYTSNPIPLPSGTILTDSNGYTCQTTSAVTIPAATSPFSAGTVSANVIATNTNKPAPANDIFIVHGYPQSSVIANNTNAFTAGNYTTNTEQVVSASNQSSLKQTLSSTLFTKGKNALINQNKNSQVIIPQSIKYVVTNATFDNQIGTPAQVLNLSEQIKVEGQSYLKSDIQALLKKKIENSSNSVKNLTYKINTTSVNAQSNITISVSYSAELFKNLNKQNIINEVKGKNFSSAKKTISSIKNINGVKITESPSIFSIFGYLPSNTKMIKITIKN